MNHAVIRTDLMRVHVEDAALLAWQRTLMTEAPNVRLVDIYEHDQRLAGHFQFLKHIGAAAVDLAAEVFDETPMSGEAIVLAALSMQAGRADFAGPICDALDEPEQGIAALSEAFRYVARDSQRSVFYAWIKDEDPRLVCAALGAATLMRLNLKDLILPLIGDPRGAVKAAALYYVGVMGLVGHTAAAVEALGDADDAVSFAAAITAARFRQTQAGPLLLAQVTPTAAPLRCRLAVELGFPILQQDDAHNAVRGMLKDLGTRRWGILGLGVIGATRTLPYLVQEMERPEAARMAGWAFAMISGANVAEDDLELDEFPDIDDHPQLEEAPEELFFDDGLPFPDVERVSDWIKTEGTRLSAEQPLLFGLPRWSYQDMDSPDLEFQARYRALAQAISLGAADNRLPNWRAPVSLQGGKLTRDWQM